MTPQHKPLFKQLLNEGCFDEFFEALKLEYFNSFSNTVETDKEARELIYFKLKAIQDLKFDFNKITDEV